MFSTHNNPFDSKNISKDELSMDDIMGLIKNKKNNDTIVDKIEHNEEDINELTEFCNKMGIVGFNCGNMNPKAALQILKKRMGYIESNSGSDTRQLLNG